LDGERVEGIYGFGHGWLPNLSKFSSEVTDSRG
jgi:hypothetical protein